MAKFLFTYFHNIEMMVQGGKPMGGSVVQTINWMKALHELGHEVVQAKEEGDKRELLEDFLWVKTVPLYHPEKFKKKAVWFTYRLPKYYSVLQKLKCDYTYASMPHWSIYFKGFICKILGVKQIIRLANDKNVDRGLANDNPRHINFLNDKGLNLSDFVIAQNQNQYEILQKKFSINNLIKLSNPIVIDQHYLVSKKEMKGYIAWLANFRHQKNLKLLFEVASILHYEKIKIAGQPLEPLDDETALYVSKLKELVNVEFVGVIPRSGVLPYLDNAKFLLSTSRYEGFSNTFLESMVTGTPILTTSAVNPDGIIEKYDLGYIYRDAEDLVKILKNINLSNYLKKSINCIDYVKEHHDHIHLGKKLLNFLNEPILNNSK